MQERECSSKKETLIEVKEATVGGKERERKKERERGREREGEREGG